MFSFVTMVSQSFLPQFMVLYQSIRKYHPIAPIRVYSGDDIKVPGDVELRKIPSNYTAERANVIEDALQDYDPVVFLGADTELFAPLTDAVNNHYDFVIVPHIICPLEEIPDVHPNEIGIWRSGVANSDFQIWRSSKNTRGIVEWYKARLAAHSEIDADKGYCGDQTWLSMIPILFDNCLMWRTKTHNVAYWNCITYGLRRAKVGWQTDGGPLALFHYSGFSSTPKEMSKYNSRWVATGDVLDFFSEYASRLCAYEHLRT